MTFRISLFVLLISVSLSFVRAKSIDSKETMKENTYDNTIHISNDTELAMASLSGSGTASDPYIIENLRMNPSSYDHHYVKTGIEISETTKHFELRNCEIDADQLTYGGIRIDEIADNTAQVYNNTVSNCYSGILVYMSKHITVRDNFIHNCEFGIHLAFTDYITLTGNNCSFNNLYGIVLMHNPSKVVTITWNTFLRNTKYGVYLFDQSSDCLIHHNNFIDNNKGGKDAFDYGFNNTWYDETTKEGNYWAQHDSTDPYRIEDSAYSDDECPLLEILKTEVEDSNGGVIPGWIYGLVVMTIILISFFQRRKWI